jgi:hypothetical protein
VILFTPKIGNCPYELADMYPRILFCSQERVTAGSDDGKSKFVPVFNYLKTMPYIHVGE